jgi:single-stranded DNA-binding protein
MRGVNHVVVSGNVTGAEPTFATMRDGKQACSFEIASHRATPGGGQVKAYIRINVYIEALVRLCSDRIFKGVYTIVDGELMNRPGQHGELTEVRAREIIFVSDRKEESYE